MGEINLYQYAISPFSEKVRRVLTYKHLKWNPIDCHYEDKTNLLAITKGAWTRVPVLEWDGEVVYQSQRSALYRAALERLRGQTYWCSCTRREVADSSLGLAADGAHIYPGICRAGSAREGRALRVRTGTEEIGFVDRLLGAQSQVLERDIGDFVLYRADGLFAYQLAVVVDDAAQGITDIVRGADLLDSTPRQIHLQQLLGLPTPRYLHVPVALNAEGEKLAKQTGAGAVAATWYTLQKALRFLGQPAADSLDEAVHNWNPALISPHRAQALPP